MLEKLIGGGHLPPADHRTLKQNLAEANEKKKNKRRDNQQNSFCRLTKILSAAITYAKRLSETAQSYKLGSHREVMYGCSSDTCLCH